MIPYDVRRQDGVELLGSLGDDEADAVVMDPPYCSGGLSESEKGSAKLQGIKSDKMAKLWFGGDNMTTGGLLYLMRLIACEADRVVHDGGSMLAFCDWRMLPMLAPAMESGGWRLRNVVVWDKGYAGLGVGFRSQHEMVMQFAKKSPKFYSHSGSNVIRCPRTPNKGKEHPTQKPIDLMRQLIEVVVPPGGLVVDPFMGSGSTGVAALLLGRRFLGAEKDPHFLEVARGRCAGACVERVSALG